jgi:hypothetical protein
MQAHAVWRAVRATRAHTLRRPARPTRAHAVRRAAPARAGGQEAGAEHVVGSPSCDRLQDAAEVRGVVLTVAVHVHGGRIALASRDPEPAPERRAQPAGHRM